MAGHVHDLSRFSHSHAFGEAGARQREKALTWVAALALLTMAGELLAGWWTGSLALTADGWHMGTHAAAIGGAALAYRLAARAAEDEGYAFGGWKIEVLAAYTSGLGLLAVATWLVIDAVQALLAPRSVAYGEAAVVAALGLAVNVVSAWLLSRNQGSDAAHGHHHHHAHAHSVGHAGGHSDRHSDPHSHGHPQAHSHAPSQAHSQAHSHPQARSQAHSPAHAQAHSPAHSHGHPQAHSHGHDHNFSAAYLHVVADAFTSVLALLALAGGAWLGAAWLDPAVALIGAVVIARWSWTVLRGSALALVDATADRALAARIRATIEGDGDAKVSDLHVWQVGGSAWCAVLSVVADRPLDALAYRQRLHGIEALRHVTVEVHRCTAGALDKETSR